LQSKTILLTLTLTIVSKIAKRAQCKKTKNQKVRTFPGKAGIEAEIKTAKATKLFSDHLRPYMKSLYVSAYTEHSETWVTYTPWGIPDVFSLGRFLIED
jgi:hypothetical protein